MKISIITASYNSLPFIKETYKSLLKQTHVDWEWLVTDDCSTDGTFEWLKEKEKEELRVNVWQNSVNSGAAASRNSSLDKISGEYVAFIDSDDLWKANKLQAQLEFMKKNNIDFSFTSFEQVDESGQCLNRKVDVSHRPNASFSYEDMLKKKATLGCSTVMLTPQLVQNFRMPNIRTGQDYAYWLKLLKTGAKASLLPQVLTEYRICKKSISRNKFKKSIRQWEIYRDIEKLNLLKSMICFCFYTQRALFRK